MLTFKKRSLAGKLLHQACADKQRPGLDILGTWHKLIPFPPRDNKTMKRKVGRALRELQRSLKGLHEVSVPKVKFPLSAEEEMMLVANLPYCASLSTFLVGETLRYTMMVEPDPESATYTTDNVTDGISQAFPDMIDKMWMDPSEAEANAEDKDKEENWDDTKEFSMELQRLAWAAFLDGHNKRDPHFGDHATHWWSHIKPPTMTQRSKKQYYAIAHGELFLGAQGSAPPGLTVTATHTAQKELCTWASTVGPKQFGCSKSTRRPMMSPIS